MGSVAEGKLSDSREGRDEETDSLSKKKDADAGKAGVTGDDAGASLRSNFSETAFWTPQLLTNADGSASIEFTVPDSVTSWNVWVHAVTKDLRGGSAEAETKTVKDLMVRPYVPRFLREGDKAEIKVVVNNASAQPLSGSVAFEIVDPATGASLLSEFGLAADAARSPSRRPRAAGRTSPSPSRRRRAWRRSPSRSSRRRAISRTASSVRCRSCRAGCTSSSRASSR